MHISPVTAGPTPARALTSPARGGESGAKDQARVRKAAADFEAVLIGQLLKEARPKDALLGRSFAAETFQDMLGQTIAQHMAERSAFGLADMLARQLLPDAAQPSGPLLDKPAVAPEAPGDKETRT